MRQKSRYGLFLGLGFIAVLGVWLFRDPLRSRIVQSATLSNPTPPPELVEEIIAASPDRSAAIIETWNTGKIVHRQAAVVMGGQEIITDFSSSLHLPLALEPACLGHTDAAFGELLRRGVIEPLEIKVRQFIQRRFDEANADQIEAESALSCSDTGRPDDRRDLSESLEAFLADEKKRQAPRPATPLDDWPDSLDQAAKIGGFPDGISTRNGAARNRGG